MGLPNAGKSTLLAALTAATPKIADYPFTTLEPNLGVMDLGIEDGRRPTIADVPGLIEGASSGAGLGHAFLRHVERTRILIHVVDGSSRDPNWDHDVIRDELAAHDPALLEKPILVAFNKIDLAAARDAWPAFRKRLRAAGLEPVAISADSGEGLDALRAAVSALLPDADGLAEPPEPAGVVVHRLEAVSDGFAVAEEDGAYRVSGKRIERLVAQTNFDNEESAERFQRELVRTGIDGALRKAGDPPGERGPHRRVGAGMGSARGRPLTGSSGVVLPPAAVVPGSLGILGGTFDPIHNGHLAIAEEARETLGLDRVLLVPAAQPPHKTGRPITAAEQRLAMVELAVAGNGALATSPIELERGGDSFTVDTLEALRRQGHENVWFILSSDALAGFPTWRDPDRILELARLAVMPRDGATSIYERWVTEHFPGDEDRIRFLPGPRLPISGSVIRRRVAVGRSIRYLVPDAVAAYIAQHRLYLDPA